MGPSPIAQVIKGEIVAQRPSQEERYVEVRAGTRCGSTSRVASKLAGKAPGTRRGVEQVHPHGLRRPHPTDLLMLDFEPPE